MQIRRSGIVFATAAVLGLVAGLALGVDPVTAGGPPAGEGETFFTARVLPELEANGCGNCHIPAAGYVHPAVSYAELLPFLAMGRAADNNVLVQKMANLRSFRSDRPAHIGGQRCESLAVEPCQSIMAWWEVEFGPNVEAGSEIGGEAGAASSENTGGEADAQAGGESRAEVIGIVDVATTAPDDVATYPFEDSPRWRVTGSERPQTADRDDFLSADGAFHVGYSQYDTMTLEIDDWPWDELMFLIEGQVEITDRAGVTKTYGPGEIFLMPRGFSGTWKQLGPIKKIAASYGPE